MSETPNPRLEAVAMLHAYKGMVRKRDTYVIQARCAGLSKREIWQHSGIARTTIDRILARHTATIPKRQTEG
jgi:hypothetical protein